MKYKALALVLALGTQINADLIDPGKIKAPEATSSHWADMVEAVSKAATTAKDTTGNAAKASKEAIAEAADKIAVIASELAHKTLPTLENGEIDKKTTAIYATAAVVAIAALTVIVKNYSEELKNAKNIASSKAINAKNVVVNKAQALFTKNA